MAAVDKRVLESNDLHGARNGPCFLIVSQRHPFDGAAFVGLLGAEQSVPANSSIRWNYRLNPQPEAVLQA